MNYITAMYKTRNTGTGNRMQGTRGIGGMLYSEECRQTFWGMPSKIPENVANYSGECYQTFRGVPSNISGNVLKHSGEYPQTFQVISSNVPGNVVKHSLSTGRLSKSTVGGLTMGCSFIHLFHCLKSI